MLSKMKAEDGETSACQYAMIHAQWGNRAKALECPETALRLSAPGPLAQRAALSGDGAGAEVSRRTVSACFPKPDGGDRLQGVRSG